MEKNKEEKPLPLVKKKRQSGKRKPKEHVSSKPVIKQEELIVDAEITISEMIDKNIIDQIIENSVPKELSKQADNWRLWLERYKFTPEQFLEKYPTHKFKHLIEEVINFQAKK